MKKNTKVFISGHFNIIHPGHIRLFRYAKEIGDILIVGVESDKIAKNKSYIKQRERIRNLQTINLVDKTVIISKGINETIATIKPNIILKGKEFEEENNIEDKIANKINAKLVFSSGESMLSLSSFQDNQDKLFQSRNFPMDYFKRHDLKINDLKNTIKSFKGVRVCVIGDPILDEYIDCKALGMSQEEPMIVSKPLSKQKYLGGAAITALHSSGLGAKTTLISTIGNDLNGKYIKKKLKSKIYRSYLFEENSRVTVHKQRFRINSSNKFRLNNFSDYDINKNNQNKIYNKFKAISDKIDVLIFSDFNYGVLTEELTSKIIQTAKEKNIFISADNQSSSQIGNLKKYKKVDLITPTEHETRIAINDYNSGLTSIIQKIKNKCDAKFVLMKLGPDGLLIFNSLLKTKSKHTDLIKALNTSPKDTNGAGDSLLVSASLSMYKNNNIWLSALIGSLSASIQVNKVGNIYNSTNELLELIKVLEN